VQLSELHVQCLRAHTDIASAVSRTRS
jgi:hypothetical protein